MREVQGDAGRVLEIEHPGQAVRDPGAMGRRRGIEEQAEAGHVAPLRGVVQRLGAELLRAVAGVRRELVHVGAGVEEHPGELGIVRNSRRAKEARLDGRPLTGLEVVRVGIGPVIEQDPHDANDALGAPPVAAQEAREAGVEDRRAAERPASPRGERRVARQELLDAVVHARDARRVQVERRELRLGAEEHRRLSHLSRARGPDELGGASRRIAPAGLHELLPARPALAIGHPRAIGTRSGPRKNRSGTLNARRANGNARMRSVETRTPFTVSRESRRNV